MPPRKKKSTTAKIAKPKKRKGFTMIELIIVVAIITGIAGMVFVALNAPERIENAIEAQEQNNAKQITKALQLSIVDKLELPPGVTVQDGGVKDVCKQGVDGVSNNCINLDDLVADGYLPKIPVKNDFVASTIMVSGYEIARSGGEISIRPRSGGGGSGGSGGSGGNGGSGGSSSSSIVSGGSSSSSSSFSYSSMPSTTYAYDELPNPEWDTNGDVRAIAYDPATQTTFLGGDFTEFKKYVPYVALLDDDPDERGDSIASILEQAYVGGDGLRVTKIISDGAGGYYVAGTFTQVNASAIRIAHIFSNGTVDASFNPNQQIVSGTPLVYDMILDAGTLYVAGQFTTIGDGNPSPRSNLAAIDATTGDVLAWSPNPNGIIYDIETTAGKMYVTGSFTSIAGQSRRGIAAFDRSTLAIDAGWNAQITTGTVVYRAIAEDDDVVLLGDFSMVGGQSRVDMARVTQATGALDASFVSNLNTGGFVGVRTGDVDGSTLYIGGLFSSVNGTPRQNLAAINVTTGAVQSWNPSTDDYVGDIEVEGSTVYIAGTFSQLNGTNRNAVGAVSTDGDLKSWDPSPGPTQAMIDLNIDLNIIDLFPTPAGIILGGNFGTINHRARARLAAIDANGSVTDFDPGVSGPVRAMAIRNNALYVGGSFVIAGGQSRANLAAIDITDGSILSWNPSANGSIYALAADPSQIFIGGAFTDINGDTSRQYAGAVDTSGNITAWNPNVTAGNGSSAAVRAIASNGNMVFLGGDFEGVNDPSFLHDSSRHMAVVNTTDGATIGGSFNITGANATVRALAIDNATVFAAGTFTSVNGSATAPIFRYDMQTPQVTSWQPDIAITGTISALARNGTRLVVGGDMTVAGFGPQPQVGQLSTADGTELSGWIARFTPSGSDVHALAVSPQALHIGGGFADIIGAEYVNRYARLPSN